MNTRDTGASAVVIVPCHNEELTIQKVVSEFRRQRGVIEVVVVDNCCTDRTAALAAEAGARVVRELRPGKGFALVAGLREAGEASFYVMVDGDDTYPADAFADLLRAASAGADMVIGTRLATTATGAFRPGHDLGNRLFITLVRLLFGLRTQDLFSGYRVLSRRFVDAVPLLARGFEVELELSLQALSHRFVVQEIPVAYRSRPEGSASKLRTYVDGYKILRALAVFLRDYRPLAFFGALGGLLGMTSLAFGSVVVGDYIRTGLVPRVPLAVLSAGLFLLGGLSFTAGILLTSINRRAAEIRDLIARKTSRPFSGS